MRVFGKVGSIGRGSGNVSHVWKIVGKFSEKLKTIDCYIVHRVSNPFTYSINFLITFLIHPENISYILVTA